LCGLRTPPFLHATAGVVHVDAGGLAHGIDGREAVPAVLLEQLISGGKDAVAGFLSQFHAVALLVDLVRIIIFFLLLPVKRFS